MGPASSRQLCLINGVHSIKTRTPSELECSQTNGALCFINPLFFKVHSQDLGGGPRRPCTRTPDADGTERPRSPPPRPPPPAQVADAPVRRRTPRGRSPVQAGARLEAPLQGL